jgi:hypothetical protein
VIIASAMLGRPVLAAAAELIPGAPVRETRSASRVAIVHDPAASEGFTPDPARVATMLRQGLERLTRKPTVAEAWRSLVATNDTVGIKVLSAPGPASGTRPAAAAAVVEQLIEAGIPARQIVVWDKHMPDLRRAGFCVLAERYGVRVAGSAEAGYDDKVHYDSALIGRLVWGDFEFGRTGEGVGRKSYVSRLVSRELTKIVSLAPLLNHNQIGVSGHLYGLALGSVDNTLRFENDPERLATAVPEIYALAAVGDKVVLNITDALVSQYFGEESSLLHYAVVPAELWISRDPVALDVLGMQELERQRDQAKAPRLKPKTELYQNAALLELGIADARQLEILRLP